MQEVCTTSQEVGVVKLRDGWIRDRLMEVVPRSGAAQENATVRPYKKTKGWPGDGRMDGQNLLNRPIDDVHVQLPHEAAIV